MCVASAFFVSYHEGTRGVTAVTSDLGVSRSPRQQEASLPSHSDATSGTGARPGGRGDDPQESSRYRNVPYRVWVLETSKSGKEPL